MDVTYTKHVFTYFLLISDKNSCLNIFFIKQQDQKIIIFSYQQLFRMILSKSRLFRQLYKYSRSKQFDIVFVGPLATRLSNEIHHEHHNKFSCLNINFQQTHLEPTLYPFQSTPIPISTITPSHYPSISSNISSIHPESNLIVLNNQERVFYNQLVHTSNSQPDLSKYQGLQQALNNPCSNVFVNDGANLNNLKQLSLGNLIFSIPSGRHLGEDNYQFLSINDYVRKRLRNNKEESLKVTTYLILEDGKIFKHSKQLDDYAKQQCRLNNITILENVKVTKIDQLNRKLILSSGQNLSYAGYYQYLPLKQSFEFGPTNPQTLNIQKYPNIFIFGNAQVPTTHSFGAKNYQLRVVKENLVNNLLGIKKTAQYDGRTILPLLTSANKAIYFTHSYTKKIRSFGKFGPWNIALAKMEEWFGPDEVKNYYRFKTYGYPFYLWNKKAKIVKSNSKSENQISEKYQLNKKVQT